MLDRTIAPSAQSFQKFSIKRVKSLSVGNIPIHFLISGSQPIIRLEFIFRAGAWYDQKVGLSYLVAKMLNEGTSKHSGKEIAEIIAVHGAFIEIHHSLDHVNVTFYLLEKHFETLVPLLFEILTQSVFPDQELTNLKNITCQNLKVNKEKGQFLSSVEFRKALFGSEHPYGKQYWEKDIMGVTRDEITDFFNGHYKLSDMEIFISGQFDEENLLRLLENYFDSVMTSRHSGQDFVKAATNRASVLIEKADAVQSSIRMGRFCITRSHAEYPFFSVLNELFGGFFGSRLMKNIREEKGYTYGIHSSIQTMNRATYFIISTDVKRENAQHTIDEVWKEMDRLRTELVSEQELETVKSYMIGKFMNSINTPFALMDKFKNIHFSGLEYDYFDSYLHKVQHVTPPDLLQLAQANFVKDDFCQVVVGGLS